MYTQLLSHVLKQRNVVLFNLSQPWLSTPVNRNRTLRILPRSSLNSKFPALHQSPRHIVSQCSSCRKKFSSTSRIDSYRHVEPEPEILKIFVAEISFSPFTSPTRLAGSSRRSPTIRYTFIVSRVPKSFAIERQKEKREGVKTRSNFSGH